MIQSSADFRQQTWFWQMADVQPTVDKVWTNVNKGDMIQIQTNVKQRVYWKFGSVVHLCPESVASSEDILVY